MHGALCEATKRFATIGNEFPWQLEAASEFNQRLKKQWRRTDVILARMLEARVVGQSASVCLSLLIESPD
jgi:hypothetical protein